MTNLSLRRTIIFVLLIALAAGATSGIIATVMLDATLEEYAAMLFAGRAPGTPGGSKPREASTNYDLALEAVRTVSESSVATITLATLDSRLSSSWIGGHQALGYGVVVSADGWVLLGAEVLTGVANPLRGAEVWIGGERYVPTQVVRDSLTDATLLKISANGLTPVAFAASESVVPGTQVFGASTSGALLAMTVSDARKTSDLSVLPAEAFAYAWQVSEQSALAEPIFAGDGSLLALQAGQGATPIHLVSAFVKEVIRDGAPLHAGFGAYVVDLEEVLNIDLTLRGDEAYGAIVVSPSTGAAAVVRSSPASVAGVLAGDIITSVDGVRVDHATTLAEHLRLYDPGETAVLTLVRGGAEQTITVTFVDYADLLY